jgi:hypothetical protein
MRLEAWAVSGQESAPLPVRAGVPQGSVLGPTLFLVFLRDMGEGVQSSLDQYADDSTLHRVISSRTDRTDAASIINADLRTVQQWADTWCAKFNATKTHALTISHAHDETNRHQQQPPLFLDGSRLEEVEQLTIVGLTINRRLTWGDHVRKVAMRTGQQIGALRRARSCLPQTALLAAYKGTVRACMEYLSPVWCGGPSVDLQLLHRLQDRALQLLGLSNASDHLLRQMRLQPLQERWAVSSLALLHRAVSGTAPQCVSALVPGWQRRDRRTRAGLSAHGCELCVPKSRTSHHMASLLPRTIRQWNSLPAAATPDDGDGLLDLAHFKKLVTAVAMQLPT